jgi:hypothetical protein
LVTGIYTTNVPTVFADSRILKLETKQNANCATPGGGDSLSDSCNQRAANNVINGVPRTAVNQKLRELYWLKRSVTSSSSTSANDSLIVDAKTFLPTFWILDGCIMPIISFSEYDYLVKNFSYYESNI